MKPAARRLPASNRSWRLWAAVAAALALAFAPLIAVSQASADPTGYQGENLGGGSWADSFLEGTMTAGVEYEAMLRGPDDNRISWNASGLPEGLSLDTSAKPTLRIWGVPETADGFDLTISGDGEDSPSMRFTGTVEAGTSPSITSLTVADAAPYDSIGLTATVAGNPSMGETPTGTVGFYASGTVLIATATLVAGVATATGSVDIVNAGGNQMITAKYLGDDNYSPSASAAAPVLIYVTTAQGSVQRNGQPVSGATVALLDGTSPEIVVDTATTDATGGFTLSPGAIASATDAAKLYYIRATYPDAAVLYFVNSGHDVTALASASQVGPKTWKRPHVIQRYVAPVWTDTTLSTPRNGSQYTDAVAATSPSGAFYYVSDGDLPDGLSLDESSGAVTGTPDCESDPCAYSFTITASNGYGSVEHQFTGTVLPAGVVPTWTDEELVPFQVSIPVSDGVAAAGDPTITYAVTAGELPAGLELSTANGAITGTPTSAGAFTFTVTATNEFGSITTDFSGTVAEAPVIDLTLDFEAGTPLSDASSTISASGLKIGSDYTLTMHSAPVLLYSGVIGSTGGFTWHVALPANTPAGAHRLVLTGIAPDGSTLTAEAWFTLLADGTIGAISYSGPLPYSALASTGANAVLPLGLAVTMLAFGVFALVSDRRRGTR